MAALNMAAGDVMLDADGNVILDADGNVLLDDGAGCASCCGGCYVETFDCVPCGANVPGQFTIVISGVTVAAQNACFGAGPFSSKKHINAAGSAAVNGTWCLDAAGVGPPCSYGYTNTDVNIDETHSNGTCTSYSSTGTGYYRQLLVSDAGGGQLNFEVDFTFYFLGNLTFTPSDSSKPCDGPVTINNSYTSHSGGRYGYGGSATVTACC